MTQADRLQEIREFIGESFEVDPSCLVMIQAMEQTMPGRNLVTVLCVFSLTWSKPVETIRISGFFQWVKDGDAWFTLTNDCGVLR